MTAKPLYAPRHARTSRYWLVRLKSGEITAREVAKLKAWLGRDARHRAAFEHERAFLSALAQQHDAFQNQAMTTTVDRPARRSWRWQQGLGFAAATTAMVLLVLLTPQAWLAAKADHRTGIAPTALTLADGTQVALDADSAIAVAYDTDERRVDLLRGRAWFDVAPGQAAPFAVTALGGITRDIGTRFEVVIDEGQARTSVEAGLVEVAATPGGLPVRAKAGEMVQYRKGGPITGPAPVVADSVAAWRTGEILLHEAAPSVAIERIGRYRKGPVWVVGRVGPGRSVSGLFRTDRPDQAIRVIAGQLGARVIELPGGALVVYGR